MLLSYGASAQCYTVENVPNTKLVNNSYVSNPNGILSASSIAQIDAALGELERQTSVQVAVVVVNSICSGDIFGFAQDLFNTWGIGHRQNDNGVLVLLVMDLRTVRFHTGYGVEGVLTDAMCKRIQMSEMIPSFKEGDYNAGVVSGINGIVRVVTDPDYLDELQADIKRDNDGWPVIMGVFYIFGGIVFLFVFAYHNASRLFANSKKPKQGKYSQLRLKRWQWVTEFGAIPALIPLMVNFSPTHDPILVSGIMLYSYFVITLFHKRIRMGWLIKEYGDDYFKITELLRHYITYWLVVGIFFPVPMFFYFFIYIYQIRYYRNHPRNCPKCSAPLHKLDEVKDDEHLNESQVFEEQLKSVDYDVWLCSSCSYKNTYTFKSKFSRYSKCPKCKTIALYTKSRTTVVSPTYESSGRGEELKLCKYCKHSQVSSYTIAKLTRSSSSSSSGGSSGGGSWGGGSSGGGGASSSW